MEKPAEVQHPVHDLIRRRWSPRAFDPRPLAPEHLASLLEAARWAPSSMNEQPWRFVVATRDDAEGFERLLGCLVPGNQVWARDAGALLLSVASLSFARGGKANRHAYHDVGLASGQLALQAVALGLALHFMAGYDAEAARERLAIPAGFDPVAAIAVGYPGDPARLSDELRSRELAPRSRRGIDEIVFGGRWDQVWQAPPASGA